MTFCLMGLERSIKVDAAVHLSVFVFDDVSSLLLPAVWLAVVPLIVQQVETFSPEHTGHLQDVCNAMQCIVGLLDRSYDQLID